MSKPPRVLVSGYYGFGNAGDEAILAGLIEGFRTIAPEVELVVLSGSPAATNSEHSVAAVPRGLGSVRRRARQDDLLVSGGGGLLQDVTSWRSPFYYLAVMALARAAGRPVACVGQGIGPLRRRFVRACVRHALSRADVVAVRDRPSSEALRDLGVARAAEVTADLAFLLPRPTNEHVERAWQRSRLPRDPRPIAAIALRPSPAGQARSDLAQQLGMTIGRVCLHLGLRAALIPMQSPRDVEFAERVARAMPFAPELVPPALSARDVLAFIGGCDLVVAMRLHALIFAAICGVPMVAVSYDPKVDALMEQLGLQSATSVGSFDEGALAGAAAAAWGERRELSRRLLRQADELRSSALRNIELALGLLGRP